MPFENIVDSSESIGESYTCVSFNTLQFRMPGVELDSVDIVRDYPEEPLAERDFDDLEHIREHPFFKL